MAPNNRDTLYLLLLTHSQNSAESLVSLLRNSGRATRAHMVTSIDDFLEQLQDKSWDLVLAEPSAQGIESADLLKQIKRLDKDLPVIMLLEEIEPMQQEAYLKQGACDAVLGDESNLLSLVIQRELNNLNHRRTLRTTQVKLRDAEKRTQGLLESSKNAVTYIHDGMHIYSNQAYLDLFGYDCVDDLEGMPVIDMVGRSHQNDFKKALKLFHSNGGHADLKYNGVKTNNQEFPVTMSLSSATYADEACTQIIIRAKSDNSELDERLKAINSRDQLTGLLNKPKFMDVLEENIDVAVLKGIKSAVMCINIDRFGKVKSSVGINNSDLVLSAIADYLKSASDEHASLARIGEDIFTWIRPNTGAEQALEMAEKIRIGIERLIIKAGASTVTVTSSIGIALINECSSEPSTVLQHAHEATDALRQQAGHEAGNGVHLYIEQTESEKVQEKSIEERVITALKDNDFSLLFQPLINLKGEEEEHYETLLRLPMNDGEVLSAGDFINDSTISDELKHKIDRWVILHATKLLSEHKRKGIDTRLFINLSAASLLDDSLASWIGVALNAAKLDKQAVIFQFNEEDANRFLPRAQAFTQELKAKGYSSALSRFGCSLKPFQALESLALDYVKIDGSFTHEISKPESLASLKVMLAELHAQGKKTIVPLVENASAVAALWQLGTHFIQGYYVQAPQAGMTYNFSDDDEE